jgi:hypothetical protein
LKEVKMASSTTTTTEHLINGYTKVKIDNPKPSILAAEDGEQDSNIKEVQGEKKDGGKFQSIRLH